MARQGHRIWPARLVTLIIGITFILVFTARYLWHRWTNAEISSLSTKVSSASATAPSETAHELDPVLDLARRALMQHKQHRDYTAVLIKRERIGGKLGVESKMEMKLRYHADSISTVEADSQTEDILPRRVSVYLKSIEPASQAGREVIWIEGANDNKLTAHEAGILGLVSVELAPNSRLAMLGNKYPITEIGIEKLLIKLIERGRQDRAVGPATVRRQHGIHVGGVDCTLIEVVHEKPFLERDGKRIAYEFPLAQIYMDEARLLPIKYASYVWPKKSEEAMEIEEEYTYENLQLDVGLTDEDFDTRNPKYRFSR